MYFETAYLAKALTQKELMVRYRGSLLGFSWMLLLPMWMATLYTAVFWGVFSARWPGVSDSVAIPSITTPNSAIGFGAQLFAGLIVFNFFVDLMVRSSRLITEHAALVKRVRFPQIALVLAMLFSGLITLGIGTLISLSAALVTTGLEQVNLVGFVLVLVQAIILALGLGLWISALAVYLRDLQQLIPAFATGLLFLSPVFYSEHATSGLLGTVIALNPMSFSIEGVRLALFHNETPEWQSALTAYITGIFALVSGYAVFQRLKPGFADLI